MVFDAGLLAHPFGKRQLEAGHALHQRACVAAVAEPRMPPEEQSITSTPSVFSSFAKTTVSSMLQPPSTSSIDETRTKSGLPSGQALRTSAATSSGKRMRFSRSAVRVAACCESGERKRVQQVAVRGVELQDLEARGHGAAHRVAVSASSTAWKSPSSNAPRRDPALVERLLGRRDGAPGLVAAVEVGLRQRAVAVPGPRHARLAPGVRELEGGRPRPGS